MLASMYGLNHRLAELRPSEAEQRLARARRLAPPRPGVRPGVRSAMPAAPRVASWHPRG